MSTYEISLIGTAVIWIGAACLMAIAGTERKMGYGTALIWCLLLGPIGFLVVLLSPGKTVQYTCRWCNLVASQPSHYCPRCLKDKDGYTVEQNKERFAKDFAPTK